MKKTIFLLTVLCLAIMSCTKEKTDYEAEIGQVVPEHKEFKEAARLIVADYEIQIEALNGTFYQGYNELRFKVLNSQTKQKVQADQLTFLPILRKADGSTSSCPHLYILPNKIDQDYQTGYAVFTSVSHPEDRWILYVELSKDNKKHRINKEVQVVVQDNMNLNMTSFIGNDQVSYIIALIAPQRPKVAENELIAGIYSYVKPTTSTSGEFPDASQYQYEPVKGYTLQLDPRMPEASMGNHSSPKNKDLISDEDGFYHGIVNYTMTGNWTLNFILLNQHGKILKGTKVPTDFTPGIEGVKSELHIDILF